jgi:DNA ligase-1
MIRFAQLYAELDETTSTADKLAALERYFREAAPADAAWALAMLAGRRPRRLARSSDLRRWAAEAAGVDDWLFEECYAQVGDLAETIALLLPERDADDDRGLATWIEEVLLPLGELPPEAQRAALLDAWQRLGGRARFVFTKLLTGAFRVGVSGKLVIRALARVGDLEEDVVAHRLMGRWEPSPELLPRVLARETADADASRPYPFFLAYPLETEPASLGAVDEWLVEWKWDGIRAQLVKRGGRAFLWSRGEELLDGRFPELDAAAAFLPDGTVLDGEILAWRDDAPLPFLDLQKRINRRAPGRKLLAEVPARLVAYDLLELAGTDLRARAMVERRRELEALLATVPASLPVALSPRVAVADWDAVAAARRTARERHAEGLMLKRGDSAYGVGRRRGDWWKWKVQPLAVDAVLLYAQAGHGRRAGLCTDYTFGVWDGGTLVPFAKAYSGLTDDELRRVDAFIKAHTLEKFGPVRTVEPRLVFELHFEGLQRSTRHKSGIAVRFPRIARWRTDKPPEEADTLETVKALLPR